MKQLVLNSIKCAIVLVIKALLSSLFFQFMYEPCKYIWSKLV